MRDERLSQTRGVRGTAWQQAVWYHEWDPGLRGGQLETERYKVGTRLWEVRRSQRGSGREWDQCPDKRDPREWPHPFQPVRTQGHYP